MNFQSYFYNCSPDYIQSIDSHLIDEVEAIINSLPKRQTQAEINSDLFAELVVKEWSYDTLSSHSTDNRYSNIGFAITGA